MRNSTHVGSSGTAELAGCLRPQRATRQAVRGGHGPAPGGDGALWRSVPRLLLCAYLRLWDSDACLTSLPIFRFFCSSRDSSNTPKTTCANERDSGISRQSQRLVVTRVLAEPQRPSRAREGAAPTPGRRLLWRSVQTARPGRAWSHPTCRRNSSGHGDHAKLAAKQAQRGLRTVPCPPGARCSPEAGIETQNTRQENGQLKCITKGKHAQSEKYSTLPKSVFIKVNKSSDTRYPNLVSDGRALLASPSAGRLCQEEPSLCCKRYFSRDRLCRYQCF